MIARLARLPLQLEPIRHLDHLPQLPVNHEAITDLRPGVQAGDHVRRTVEPHGGALRAAPGAADVEVGHGLREVYPLLKGSVGRGILKGDLEAPLLQATGQEKKRQG